MQIDVYLTRRVLSFVFVSGVCSLVYQTLWMRSFRLIFGASTMASAAVVAIFMGGLGLGSYVLGKRIDRDKEPLRRYAHYELIVAISAATTPLLISLVETLYYATGGSSVLGAAASYALRLFLALLVMGVPTFFMGGTLVAALAAVQTKGDLGRKTLGKLYGVNTLGAVFGCLLATFVGIEVFGVMRSLWIAALFNLLLGIVALRLARDEGPKEGHYLECKLATPMALSDVSLDTLPDGIPASCDKFVDPAKRGPWQPGMAPSLFAAGWVGLAFFALEMVWYRIFAPLLGGSSYSFGLVLAVALLGIGLGGSLFGLRRAERNASVTDFGVTCVVEAICILVPFALADNLVVLTLIFRGFGIFGFPGIALSWFAIASVVILPTAIVAGYQFPLIVSLIGEGKREIGRDVGYAYLTNTLGAIVGAIGGGFGLLAYFGANRLWVLIAFSLVALGCAAALYDFFGRRKLDKGVVRLRGPSTVLALSAVCVFLGVGEGPTAALRHAPVGAGRFNDPMQDRAGLENRFRRIRRNLVWEADGREVTVGVSGEDSYSFIVNGKSDGNVRGDAGTQIMCPLIGAMIHGSPRKSLVIGLGTGMSGGWMSRINGMERVDIVELEPSILKVAELAKDANFDVLKRDNVTVHLADGREFLQTSRSSYDVIMSEPSNPYRVGVASLFSRDFYRSVSEKLSERGVFVQWLQFYEVDARTVRTVIATLASEFPSVQVWTTQSGDLALVARKKQYPLDITLFSELVAHEPYKSAMANAWGVAGVEGFLAAFLAGEEWTRSIADTDEEWVDTDDRPVVEFGFSRSVGMPLSLKQEAIARAAGRVRAARPSISGKVDWGRVNEAKVVRALRSKRAPSNLNAPTLSDKGVLRNQARLACSRGHYEPCLKAWKAQGEDSVHPEDLLVIGHAAASLGDPLLESLKRGLNAVDRGLLTALSLFYRKSYLEASIQLEQALLAARSNMWFDRMLMSRSIGMIPKLMDSVEDGGIRESLVAAILQPFSGRVSEVTRVRVLLEAGEKLDFKRMCRQALEYYEQSVPLDGRLLSYRRRCYQAWADPMLETAERDWDAFMSKNGKSVDFQADPTAEDPYSGVDPNGSHSPQEPAP